MVRLFVYQDCRVEIHAGKCNIAVTIIVGGLHCERKGQPHLYPVVWDGSHGIGNQQIRCVCDSGGIGLVFHSCFPEGSFLGYSVEIECLLCTMYFVCFHIFGSAVKRMISLRPVCVHRPDCRTFLHSPSRLQGSLDIFGIRRIMGTDTSQGRQKRK